MSFASDMRLISKRIDASLEQFGRAVKRSAFSQVIDNTRVDTGRLKGNWQATEGSPSLAEIDGVDPNGTFAKAQMTHYVKGISDSYITNNLPYAPIWDEKDAIRARVVANIERNIRNAARSAR